MSKKDYYLKLKQTTSQIMNKENPLHLDYKEKIKNLIS